VSADTYRLTTWLWLPEPRERVFGFFADAHNLERITPHFLRFRILNASPIVMGPGALIDHTLRLHGVPIKWRTEITLWEPPTRFCDTQLRGPYREWIHTHTFDELDGGTMVRDEVRYQLPGPAFASRIVNALLVAPDARRIFEFRHHALCETFNARHTARVGPVTVEQARSRRSHRRGKADT
jgi:ligand-binding SRPBCC domain-containing protein